MMSTIAWVACDQSRVIQPRTAIHAPAQPSAEGTQHGGGGNVVTVKSSVEEVHRAIDIALDLMANRYFFSKPLAQFFRRPFPPSESSKHSEHEKEVLAKLDHPETYFPKSQVIRKEKGACGSESSHTDASVSAFEIGADICLSVENLTRIPRTLLLRQVVSLLIHEAAHLKGFQEEDAVDIQKLSYLYFADEFDAEKAAKTWQIAGADLFQMEIAVKEARKKQETVPNSRDVYSKIFEAAEIWENTMRSESYSWINYDLIKKPMVRSLEPNFFYSFVVIITDLKQMNSSKMQDSELSQQLSKTAEDINTAITNWQAYAYGKEKPICLLDFPGIENSSDTEDSKNNQKKCEEIARNWRENDQKSSTPMN